MDSKEQVLQCHSLSQAHSFQKDSQKIYSADDLHSKNDQDFAFSLADKEMECKKLMTLLSNEQQIKKGRRTGKNGLKYAKVNNEQREGLIKQVTSTGCTIKSAAQQLGINFSTAKAIMQIFKKEGRSCKKVIRKNKKRQTLLYKRLITVTQDQKYPEEKVQIQQRDKISKEIMQQPMSILEDQNNQQFNLIQQLKSQNVFYQDQVSNLFQENIILTQNYQCLSQQYQQLLNMMQQILIKTQSPLVPFII